MALTASSAVSFPIRSASLRSLVITMGVRSSRRTYCCEPPRFTLTTNLVLVIVLTFPPQLLRIVLDDQRPHGTTPLAPPHFCGVLPFRRLKLLALELLCADSCVPPCRAAFAGAAVPFAVC